MRTALLTLSVCVLALPANARYSGGTGEPNDPYQIATAADLIALGETPEDYDKHFILTADIDLDPNLPGRKVFDRAVIAPGWETPFSGVFDGNGHTILHLTVTGGSSLGLFGRVAGHWAEVRNVGIADVHITGSSDFVGGLAGHNDGRIAASYSTGSVSGDGYVGGLVGRNGDSGEYYLGGASITSCYSTGSVSGTGGRVGGLVGNNDGSIAVSYSSGSASGDWHVGGLVGFNYGSIATSFSSGAVTGSDGIGGLVGCNDEGSIFSSYSRGKVSGTQYVGGLVGSNWWGNGSIVVSFWDIETSGQTESACGTGLTTGEMQDINTFLDSGWDFVDEILNGTCDYWQVLPGDYPHLRFCGGTGPLMPEGLGTAERPYLIRNARDLGTVWFEPLAHCRLVQSIDLADITWSTAVIPWFGGSFDGNDYVIRNLHIQGTERVGLFGQLGSTASISDLGLEAAEVSGTNWDVGALVGSNSGSVAASYSEGSVAGTSGVGGLVGGNSGGSITDCRSGGSVRGTGGDVGGLAGRNWNQGAIAFSHSSSSVSGTDRSVGGLVGYNSDSSITASHSSGSVSGHSDVGGLVGWNNSGHIGTSYSSGSVSGHSSAGGLVGWNCGTIGMSYSTGSVSGKYDIGGLVGSNGSWPSCGGSVTHCYSTGSVSGTGWSIGGLVGCHSRGSISSSFWDIETSGQAASDDGTGKTTAEMWTASTFLDAGWDFVGETANGTEDIWWILEGQDYPQLWWELDEMGDDYDGTADEQR